MGALIQTWEAVTTDKHAQDTRIFLGYLATCAGLAVLLVLLILSKFVTSSPKPATKPKLFLFALLAVASLATTWYYMFAFFAHSFYLWASNIDRPIPSVVTTLASEMGNGNRNDGGRGGTVRFLRLLADGDARWLGLWLQDTKLFQQAWAATVASDARFWWSAQVFGFAAVWAVVLGDQASRRQKMAGTWLFMVLGQIVAISFAANLSFIFTLLSPLHSSGSPASKKGKGKSKSQANKRVEKRGSSWTRTVVLAAIVLTYACVAVIPTLYKQEKQNGTDAIFMVCLLIPHVMVFVPILLASSASSPYWVIPFLAIALQAHVTSRIVSAGASTEVAVTKIQAAFVEHPAMGSVGWDVIMCWISFGAWYFIGRE